jgi:hypothetical protein
VVKTTSFLDQTPYESLPERDADLTALAKIEAEDPEGRWLFAARMAEVFGSFPGAKITDLRDGRNRGVRIVVATNQTMYRKLAQQPGRSKPVTKQQIVNMFGGGNQRAALEDHSMKNEVKVDAKGNIVGAAIGVGISFNARDINAFINSVEQAEGLDPDLKRVLVAARKALESGTLTGADKDDAADDLGKLAEEVAKPEPQPSRVKRLFDSLTKLAPDVASILAAAAKIGALIKG